MAKLPNASDRLANQNPCIYRSDLFPFQEDAAGRNLFGILLALLTIFTGCLST